MPEIRNAAKLISLKKGKIAMTLEQYHLVLRKCPAQRQRMKDVLVYPDRGTLRPEEQTFVQLLHKQAALTVK